jgi:copper oxidase (laccase) domain-containing protein
MAPVKLVHGNEVHHYQQPLPTRPHADAVFTAVSGQKVGVVTADCLPMLMASRDGRFVCSVHAGWRGRPAALSTIVSPVCPTWHTAGRGLVSDRAAYSPLLLRSLRRILSATAGPAPVAGWPAIASGCFIPVRARSAIRSKPPTGSDNLWFDLRALPAIFARRGAPASVEWLGSCTYCTPQSLGSYRRRTHFPAPKSFQYSWIMREA